MFYCQCQCTKPIKLAAYRKRIECREANLRTPTNHLNCYIVRSLPKLNNNTQLFTFGECLTRFAGQRLQSGDVSVKGNLALHSFVLKSLTTNKKNGVISFCYSKLVIGGKFIVVYSPDIGQLLTWHKEVWYRITNIVLVSRRSRRHRTLLAYRIPIKQWQCRPLKLPIK